MKLLLRIIKDIPNKMMLYEYQDEWGSYIVDFLTAKEVHQEDPFENAILVNDKYFKNKQFSKYKIERDVIYDELNGSNQEAMQQAGCDGRVGQQGCGNIQESNERLHRQTQSGVESRAGFDNRNARGKSGQCNPNVISISSDVRYVTPMVKTPPAKFLNIFKQARNSNFVAKIFVDVPSLEDIKDAKCLILEPNMGYVLVKEDGTISAFMKTKYNSCGKFSLTALGNAISVGGDRLDCFARLYDGLGVLYCRHGFIPICRIKFDRTIATEEQNKAWIVEPPDVIFFMYCGDSVKDLENKFLNKAYPKFSDYDYVPYITEFPEWQKSLGIKDAYDFGKYVLNTAIEKWNTKYKYSFKDRFTEYTKHIFKGVK